jgi:hypothetical protein
MSLSLRRYSLTIFCVFARFLKRTRQRTPLFALWAHLQVPRKVHVGIEPIHRRHEHEQPLAAAENAHINHANVPQRVEYLWPHARMQVIIRRRRVPVHANGLRPRANHLNRHAQIPTRPSASTRRADADDAPTPKEN